MNFLNYGIVINYKTIIIYTLVIIVVTSFLTYNVNDTIIDKKVVVKSFESDSVYKRHIREKDSLINIINRSYKEKYSINDNSQMEEVITENVKTDGTLTRTVVKKVNNNIYTTKEVHDTTVITNIEYKVKVDSVSVYKHIKDTMYVDIEKVIINKSNNTLGIYSGINCNLDLNRDYDVGLFYRRDINSIFFIESSVKTDINNNNDIYNNVSANIKIGANIKF